MVVKKKGSSVKKAVRKEPEPQIAVETSSIASVEETPVTTVLEPILQKEARKSFFQQACDELGLDPEKDVGAWRETNEYISIVTKPAPFKKIWYKNRGPQ